MADRPTINGKEMPNSFIEADEFFDRLRNAGFMSGFDCALYPAKGFVGDRKDGRWTGRMGAPRSDHWIVSATPTSTRFASMVNIMDELGPPPYDLRNGTYYFHFK